MGAHGYWLHRPPVTGPPCESQPSPPVACGAHANSSSNSSSIGGETHKRLAIIRVRPGPSLPEPNASLMHYSHVHGHSIRPPCSGAIMLNCSLSARSYTFCERILPLLVCFLRFDNSTQRRWCWCLSSL